MAYPVQGAECRNHQTVPRCKDLIILAQAGAITAVFAYAWQQWVEPVGRFTGFEQVRNALSMKIATVRYPIVFTEFCAGLFSKQTFDLMRLKEIVSTLNSIAVRILCAVKPTVRRSHLAQHIFGCFFGGISVKCIPGKLICSAVCDYQQGVVIQHLLKMWNQIVSVC